MTSGVALIGWACARAGCGPRSASAAGAAIDQATTFLRTVLTDDA